MRHRKKENRDLPERMLRRSRKRKCGKIWVAYYYCGRDADGKRIEIPLGQDLAQAKLEWARLEQKAMPKVMATMGELFDRYERDIIPGKAASEIEDLTHASRLLGHSKEEITKRVYRRVGEVVSPTK